MRNRLLLMARKRLVPGYSALYLFNEGTGQFVRDHSGCGNHGMLGSSVAVDAADPTWGTPTGARGITLGGSQYAYFGEITGHDGVLQNAYSVAIRFYLATPVGAASTDTPIANLTRQDTTESKYFISLGGNGTAANRVISVWRQYINGTIAITAWASATATIAAGWHTLAINWNGATYDIWFDGEKKPYGQVGPFADAPLMPLSMFVLGTDEWLYTIGNAYFTGAVDTVLIHPVQLTDAQVRQNLTWINGPQIVPAPTTERRRAVLIQFDDGDATVYSAAYPILRAAGMVATAYIVRDLVGTAGYMTEEQLLELHTAGWDIGNHSTDHAALDGKTEAQQEASLAGCAEYLDGLGMTRASHHVAYPFGQYNADTLTAMANTGMLTGRTVSNLGQSIPVAKPYELGIMTSFVPAITAVDAKDVTTRLADTRVGIVFGHIIDSSGGPYAWTAASLQAYVNHLVMLKVTPLTISQFHAEHIA